MRTVKSLNARLRALLQKNSLLRANLRKALKEGRYNRTLVRILQNRLCELEEQLVTDKLTGIHNREGLEKHFQWIRQNALDIFGRFGNRATDQDMRGRIPMLTESVPLTLIGIDLDRFKILNDTVGHQAGDKVLRAFALMLRHTFKRRYDLPARTGGDEFAVLLPMTTCAQAEELMEELVKLFEESSDPVIEQYRDTLGGTFSYGISSIAYDQPGDSLEEAAHRADQEMYRMKRT